MTADNAKAPHLQIVTWKELADTVAYNAGIPEGTIAKERAVKQITRDLREAYDAGYRAALEDAAQHFETEFRSDADLEQKTICAEIRKLEAK